MAVSTASTLQVVSDAAQEVVKHLNDTQNEYPHTLRKAEFTSPEGKLTTFTFKSTVLVNGRPVEVTIKSV